MAIILFDNSSRNSLLPFTYIRAVADIRAGILTFRERWEHNSGQPVFVHTTEWLKGLYETPAGDGHTWVDASIIPDQVLTNQILALEPGSCLADEKGLIAGRTSDGYHDFSSVPAISLFSNSNQLSPVKRLCFPWEIMQWNDQLLRSDFDVITKGRNSLPIPASVNTLEPENIFIEEGAKLQFCTLNAATGPIYIGKHAEIMEGTVIRGPFALGEHSVIKMNSRIYGATTLGPSCMGGGEIKNVVMMGYSNKAHDGYLGDSVVGEWCNFGAGSTNSNIKNTAGEVKIWDISRNQYVGVGQKCGVIMGDYSRAAINSSINTGTMVGICCNVFGAGLLPTIISNFSWGVTGIRYVPEKAFADINNWKNLKGASLSEAETSVLRYIFAQL